MSEEGGVSWVLCTRAGWAYALSEVVPMNSPSRLCILLGVQLLENWDMEKTGQKGKCKTECWKRGILALEVLPTFFFFFSFLESLLNFLIILLLFLKNILLRDNCITEFCCFLSNLNMNQPSVYIYLLPFEPSSHIPSYPTPLG